MAYLITTTSGATLGTILPQTVNTTFSSLTLIGQALENYGQYLNDDLVALCENFADDSAPANPLVGQLWYNIASQTLNYFDGVNWNPTASRAWVSANYIAASSFTGIVSKVGNIITSDGLNADGTKPNYNSTNFISNFDSFLSAISKLDAALASSATDAAYLTLAEAQSIFAPINTPTFTGVPSGPTANPGTSSTQLATTAFVANNFLSTTVASNTYLSLTAVETNYAPIYSAQLTGAPTAPTATTGNSSSQLANTQFVQTSVTNSVNTALNTVAGEYLTIQSAQANYAPIYSPNLAGVPTAPTPSGSNSSQIVNLLYLQDYVGFLSKASIGTNGYQVLPSGIVLQWGLLGYSAPAQAVIFPVAFANNCLNVQLTVYGAPGDFNDVAHVGGIYQSYYNLYTGTASNNANAAGIGVFWFAVGY